MYVKILLPRKLQAQPNNRSRYSVSHISIHPPDFSENQGNHQNFEKSLVPHKWWLIWVRMKQKKIFFEKKKIKMAVSKKLLFSSPPILNFFCENFRYWSLGLYNELMQRALMWLNLFGRQAVRHKDNLLLQMHF